MLNMQAPSTEKNNMPQMGNPGSTFVPPPMPRSASPLHRDNPYAMENQQVREDSPASRIARSPCLSPAAEQAMARPSRRGTSVGAAGKRRGPNSPVDRQSAIKIALYEPLPPPMKVRAPPMRRQLDLPPPAHIIAEQHAYPDGDTREREAQIRVIKATCDEVNVATQEGIPEARRDHLDCVAPESVFGSGSTRSSRLCGRERPSRISCTIRRVRHWRRQ